MRAQLAESILDVASMIPSGRVLSYSDVGQLLRACGPRMVGNVLARFGSAVPWWRVIRADGTVYEALQERALARYRAEQTSLSWSARSPGTWRVNMSQALWVPTSHELRKLDELAAQLSEDEGRRLDGD